MGNGNGNAVTADRRDAVYRHELMLVDGLMPYARNARTHSPAQVDQIAASIVEFGFTNPVLVDEQGMIAGHGRLLAAKQLGLKAVPGIILHGLTDAQRRAYVLADNKIALNAGWDEALLQQELEALAAADFDMELIGFSVKELAAIIPVVPNDGLNHPNDVPPLQKVAVSQLGDVWLMGAHRVMCGDSCSAPELGRLMAGERIDCVWTDPPYNVDYGDKAEMLEAYDKGHRNTGKILNDNLKPAAFLAFLTSLFTACSEFMHPGAAIYVAHAETEGVNFRLAFAAAGFHLSACLVWKKDSLVLGRSDYQWIHEPILYGWKPGAAHRWFGGRKKVSVAESDSSLITKRPDGLYQVAVGDTVLVIEGQATIEELVPTVTWEPRPKRSDLHPTMKPVHLVEKYLLNSARPGEVVFDCCGGAGSTLIAAHRLGMQARLMELEPLYVDVIVRRWQEHTGGIAIREKDGRAFADVS